jgi:hypothetical protein
MRERAQFVGFALMRGAMAFGGKLAFLSGLVGGSVLTYVLFIADLSLPWILVAVLAALLATFAVGAYQFWDEAYRVALRLTPTWEYMQNEADVLRALTTEYCYDASGALVEPHEVSPERRVAFQRQYMAGFMASARENFDRVRSAGYDLNFDRERIGSAQIEDVVELAAAFEDVAQRWREEESKRLGTSGLRGQAA